MSDLVTAQFSGREPQLFGRAQELKVIDDLIARGMERSGVLVVIGEAGVGKTALAGAAAARAAGAGFRVLIAVGLESESDLPFACLHQLLRPILGYLDALPVRQRSALQCAFGMSDETAPDRFLVGMATLSLLSEAAEHSPILIAIDDPVAIDACSVDALAFAVRRLQAERIAVLVASREERPVEAFHGTERLHLEALPERDSLELFEAQGWSLPPAVRSMVLRAAAGNPLALVELTTAARRQAAGWEDLVAGGLPISERLEQVFGAKLRDLPAGVRQVLILAAASDNNDVRPVLRAAQSRGLEVDAFRIAADAGLVSLRGEEFRCRHPLVRSIIYHSATPQERKAAHLSLAEALASEPERKAWHVAAVTFEPDEPLAALLESTAERARTRGGYIAAARALERAAELSSSPPDVARRLSMALRFAFEGGHAEWVELLAGKLDKHTTDPAQRAAARIAVGHFRALSGRGLASRAVPVAELADYVAINPETGLPMLALAAGVAFSNSDQELRTMVQVLATSMPSSEHAPERLYALAACDSAANARSIKPSLAALSEQASLDDSLWRTVGITQWHLDQHEMAASTIGRAIEAMRSRGEIMHLPPLLTFLGFSRLWLGDWREARSLASEGLQLALDTGQPLIVGTAQALMALITSLQGDSDGSREFADAALATSSEAFVAAVANWALGLLHLAEGQPEQAREYLLRACEPSRGGHFEVASWAIADLAECVVAVGAPHGFDDMVEQAARRVEAGGSVRAQLVMKRALASLASDGKSDEHFGSSLSTAGAARWPFEQARTRLGHGIWLRRQRRVLEARDALGAALETFERLGAPTWSDRARAELRAAGVSRGPRAKHALDELTPQQAQIAQLAAGGLSNREIGGRLFLSPRTVGFHLYNIFPKLQITTRAQLSEALSLRDDGRH